MRREDERRSTAIQLRGVVDSFLLHSADENTEAAASIKRGLSFPAELQEDFSLINMERVACFGLCVELMEMKVN